jgi:aldose 1-epimerase
MNVSGDSTALAQSAFSARLVADSALQTDVVELCFESPDSMERRVVAAVAPAFGSNLVRLDVGEHRLIHVEPGLVRAAGWTGCFVLWPIPNRVRARRYRFGGREFELPAMHRPGGDPLLIHGLVLDRVWQHDEPYATEREAGVRTWVTMAAGSPHFDVFPFPSRLMLHFRLSAEGLRVEYEATNLGDEPMPHGFALHPYFRTLSGPDRTLVSLSAEMVMEADDQLLPTGRLLPVDSVMYGQFDLRAPRPLADLRLDHVYTGWDPAVGASIDFPDQGFRLRGTASAEFTHSVIYTLGSPDWFCLEHQTCSTDALNLAAEGRNDIAHLLTIGPGERMSGWIRYGIEHETVMDAR